MIDSAGCLEALPFPPAVWGIALTEVGIDIKPGTDANSINLRTRGVLPVAILGSDAFDVTRITPSSIQLGGVDIATRGPARAPRIAYSLEDVNLDGTLDLVAFFDVPALVGAGALSDATNTLTLTAALVDGTPIEGTDFVEVVP